MCPSQRDSGHKPLMISWAKAISPVRTPYSEMCSQAVHPLRARYFGVHLGETIVTLSREVILICYTVVGKPPWRGFWRSRVTRLLKSSAPLTRGLPNSARLLKKPRISANSRDGWHIVFVSVTNLTLRYIGRRLYSLTRSTGSTNPNR